MIELTQTVSEREMKNQLLDNMELERERGITIKLQTLRMYYKAKDDKEYLPNLIDTPGHADFGYEVSRSIAACEGTILLVDATQGVQAQTLANLKLAKEQGIVVIPVINKIDMANADVESVIEEMKSIEEIDSTRIMLASAKTGGGVKEIMEQIIENIPAPPGAEDESLQAKGKEIITKMKYVIPREDIPLLRKSVTGKGYSGSASKKKKIAKTIKENSIRQRKFGKADIPQEAFQAILDIR